MISETPSPTNNNSNNNMNNNTNNNETLPNQPQLPFETAELFATGPVPFASPTTTTETALFLHQERARRQRTLRIFMMFLMLLLLMDGDEQQQRQQAAAAAAARNKNLRKRKFSNSKRDPWKCKSLLLYHQRRFLDSLLERKEDIINSQVAEEEEEEEEEQEKRMVIPRNVTGYYRGEWSLLEPKPTTTPTTTTTTTKTSFQTTNISSYFHFPNSASTSPGVHLLPLGYTLQNNTNLTFTKPPSLQQTPMLSSTGGRIAFQLYMKTITGMSNVYVVDGFIKLYNHDHKDLLIRAHGLFLSLEGQLTLVANAALDRSVFYIPSVEKKMNFSRFNLTNNPYEVFDKDLLLGFPYIPLETTSSEDSSSELHQANKILPIREQALQANAASCEFEIKLNVSPTLASTTKLSRLASLRKQLIQYANPSSTISKPILPKELLVTHFKGSMQSNNCQLYTNITTATALRIDWESTTGKAINYSFYMMLTCLTQIVVLLRQLLHTQAQSAASRVSLLCIGWQTLLDALLCIGHVLLCLMMQPLFTAFASVAFFKLLIFCVIEMKYMAIILQARNSILDRNHQERTRQMIAQLHVRFYVCLFMTLLVVWYMGKQYLSIYILLLYSFWIPQIIQNIITEAKRPLHIHYIYGITLTRCIAPLYIFGYSQNFLKQVNPDFPIHPSLCLYVVLWLCVQACILICQGKYGARFMIPSRFLPPKFDYGRPIPSSLLQNVSVNQQSQPSHSTTTEGTVTTTRNRNKHNNHENTSNNGNNNSTNTLDCVICYNPIDIHDSRGYMLAPCDHIFHRHCLEQWMDVKMECPICRMDLPPI